VIFSLIVASSLLAAPAEAAGGVTLEEHHGELDSSAAAPLLRFTVKARNRLSVPVDGVLVGILFAETAAVLEAADPSKLYARGPAGGERIGVVKQLVHVRLAPHALSPIELALPVRPGQPEPRAFFTHVLSYGLADADAGLLFQLLETQAPADEAAAVDALALNGDRPARQAARLRWAGKANLLRDLLAEATRAIPERPNEAETFRRVFVVRALGVLGGDAADKALRSLLRDGNLSRFDEPFQVLRIARLMSSEFETPLAFAVPVTAPRLVDLVTVALDDVQGLEQQTPSEEPAPLPVAPTGYEIEAADAGQSISLPAVAEGAASADAGPASPGPSASVSPPPAAASWQVMLGAVFGGVAGACAAALVLVRRGRRR
jgi:hypothetical protein